MKALLYALGFVCLLSGPALADTAHTVEIHNFTFNPPAITIHAGENITWINHDDSPHTVAEAGKTWRSAALDTGDTFSHTFTQPGTYHYFCTMHPQMTGTVEVKP